MPGFGQQFWKTIVIYEVNVLKFVFLQSLVQKRSLNMRPNMTDLAICELAFENIFVFFEIRALKFFLFSKFCERIKMPKYEIKNTLLVFFGLQF